jgi:hypothetical protein
VSALFEEFTQAELTRDTPQQLTYTGGYPATGSGYKTSSTLAMTFSFSVKALGPVERTPKGGVVDYRMGLNQDFTASITKTE